MTRIVKKMKAEHQVERHGQARTTTCFFNLNPSKVNKKEKLGPQSSSNTFDSLTGFEKGKKKPLENIMDPPPLSGPRPIIRACRSSPSLKSIGGIEL